MVASKRQFTPVQEYPGNRSSPLAPISEVSTTCRYCGSSQHPSSQCPNFFPLANLSEEVNIVSDDNHIFVKKGSEILFKMANDSTAGSAVSDFAKSIDEYYAAKTDWMAKAEKALSQRPTEEEIQQRKESDPAKSQYHRVPRYNDKLKRYKRKKTADKTDSELSAFANLSLDDEKPLASDEEYVDIRDFDVTQWMDMMNDTSSSKGKK